MEEKRETISPPIREEYGGVDLTERGENGGIETQYAKCAVHFKYR